MDSNCILVPLKALHLMRKFGIDVSLIASGPVAIVTNLLQFHQVYPIPPLSVSFFKGHGFRGSAGGRCRGSGGAHSTAADGREMTGDDGRLRP